MENQVPTIDTTVVPSNKCKTTINNIWISSIFILLACDIYSEVSILKVSQEFSNSQPTNAIVLFILELCSLYGLIFIESGILKKTYVDLCTVICCIFIILAIEWVPRGFAYAEVFQFIMDDKNRSSANYDILKNNLYASTFLHSVSVIFNFIMFGLAVYYERKKETNISIDIV